MSDVRYTYILALDKILEVGVEEGLHIDGEAALACMYVYMCV